MKLRHICIVILACIAASGLRAADLYSLYPAASGGTSLEPQGGEALVLTRLAGNTGGAVLFKLAAGSPPQPLSTFDYGQRDASAVSESDNPVKIIRTSDRGHALLVELMSYSAPRAGLQRQAAIWLIKLSAGGKQEWAEVYRESGLGYKPFGMIQTSDGGYLITGSTMQGKVWKSLLLKTDSRGKLAWKKSIPSPSYASFAAAAQVAGGGYVLYGYDNVQDRTNYWLVGAGPRGDRLWQKTWPGMGDTLRFPVLREGPGGSLFGLVKSEQAAPKLLSFSKAGTLALEAPVAGMKPSDAINNYLVLSDGSTVFCGSAQNSTSDILLQKNGPGNRLLWRRTIHVEGDDIGLRLVKTEDPGFLVIATTAYSYDYRTTTYSYKHTVIKTDDNGNRLWAESFSLGRSDSVADAAVIAGNRCVILISTIRNARQEALVLVTEPGGRIGTIREQ